jgi:acetolactate synthase-1/3 small subunit
MWAILSLLVENKPGILFKITHMFRSRNFNIDSISVGVTENPEFSRMTITTIGDEKQVTQIVKQLDKMIDTIEVIQRIP